MLLTQESHVNYEELCRLDVLGLADTPEHDQGAVYTESESSLSEVKRVVRNWPTMAR